MDSLMIADFNGYADLVVMIISHPLVLMVLGLLTHFVKAFAEIMKATGIRMTPWSYYVQNPWHSLLAVIGALVGYALLIGEVNMIKLDGAAANAIRINAFFIGYMADSVLDMLGQRSTVARPPT